MAGINHLHSDEPALSKLPKFARRYPSLGPPFTKVQISIERARFV